MRNRVKESKIQCKKIEGFKDVSNLIKPRLSVTHKLKRKSLEINNLNKELEKELMEKYYVGLLLWGKLKSYPWWPCMVYKDPENVYFRNFNVHVVYFGPIVERGWLNINSTMPYDGKEKYDEIVLKANALNNCKKVLKEYFIHPRKIDNWNKAWQEAEEAMLLKLTKRIRNHGILYENMMGKMFDSVSDDSDSHSSDNTSVKLVLEMPSSSSDNNTEETTELNCDHNTLYETSGAGLKPSLKVEDESIRAELDDHLNIRNEVIIKNNLEDEIIVNNNIEDKISVNKNIEHECIVNNNVQDKSTIDNNMDDESSVNNNIQDKSTLVNNIEDESIVDNNMEDERIVNNNMKDESIVYNNIENESIVNNNIENKSIVNNNIENKSIVNNNIENEIIIKNKVVMEDTNDYDFSKNERKSLTMEFTSLKVPLFSGLKRSMTCMLCLKDSYAPNNMIINCLGNCGQTFHINCMKMLLAFLIRDEIKKPILDYKKCVDCNKERRRCFMCHKLINEKKPDEMIKCFLRDCGRYFHYRCINDGIYQNFVRNSREGSITCPSHTCHSCHCDNPSTVRHAYTHIRCIMCPASYHRGDWCIPAGSKEINDLYIVCPQHLKHANSFDVWIAPFMGCIKDNYVTLDKYNFQKTKFFDVHDLWIVKKSEQLDLIKTNNVTFCFLCSTGGHLICCEKCPASFHQSCLKITDLPDFFVCEECQLGKYPRYGEVIWAKIGTFRWWPGEVIHKKNAPSKLTNLHHEDGQFLVRFFGTYDYFWCTKMHVFSFDEGDDELNITDISSSESTVEESASDLKGRKKLDDSYGISLKLAGKVYRRRFKKWKDIIDNNDRPNHYIKIKNNIPIGKVRIQKLSCASESHRCECKPSVGNNDRDPCGPSSDCINRQVQYECHPFTCRNQDKCRNQRFMLREYPKQKIFRTKDRGWALKTLERIKKGSFVIEYVGELIDNEEANRRLNVAHENDITNYYMMILDSQRIIDAGPAANESRFINHSCSPNVFTQQWFVNGDHRIGIFALCDIEAGEELTFNYHFVSFGEMKIPCKCGAENCSGYLGLAPKPPSCTDLQNFVKDPKIKKAFKRLNKDEINDVQKEKIFKSCCETETIKEKAKERNLKEDVDDFCFICREKECDIVCSHYACIRSYHYECLGLKAVIGKKQWFCPWHFCDECGKRSEILCSFCITSYCSAHLCDRIVIAADDIMKCLNHCRILKQRPVVAEYPHSPI